MKKRDQARVFRSLQGGKNGNGVGARGKQTPPTPPATPPALRDVRCDEVLVSLVMREYDANGIVIGEFNATPVKIFRATTNIWPLIDAELAAKRQQAVQQVTGAPSPTSPVPPTAPATDDPAKVH